MMACGPLPAPQEAGGPGRGPVCPKQCYGPHQHDQANAIKFNYISRAKLYNSWIRHWSFVTCLKWKFKEVNTHMHKYTHSHSLTQIYYQTPIQICSTKELTLLWIWKWHVSITLVRSSNYFCCSHDWKEEWAHYTTISLWVALPTTLFTIHTKF